MNAIPFLGCLLLLGVCVAGLIRYHRHKTRQATQQDDVITVAPMFQRSSAHMRKGGPFNFCKRGCC